MIKNTRPLPFDLLFPLPTKQFEEDEEANGFENNIQQYYILLSSEGRKREKKKKRKVFIERNMQSIKLTIEENARKEKIKRENSLLFHVQNKK